MPRPFAFLVAVAALGSAPLAANAQTWSASTTAGARSMTPHQPQKVRKASSLRPADLRRAASPRKLNLNPTLELGSPPEVDLRARAEWYDDQGFRLSPTRVAFKRRF